MLWDSIRARKTPWKPHKNPSSIISCVMRAVHYGAGLGAYAATAGRVGVERSERLHVLINDIAAAGGAYIASAPVTPRRRRSARTSSASNRLQMPHAMILDT